MSVTDFPSDVAIGDTYREKTAVEKIHNDDLRWDFQRCWPVSPLDGIPSTTYAIRSTQQQWQRRLLGPSCGSKSINLQMSPVLMNLYGDESILFEDKSRIRSVRPAAGHPAILGVDQCIEVRINRKGSTLWRSPNVCEFQPAPSSPRPRKIITIRKSPLAEAALLLQRVEDASVSHEERAVRSWIDFAKDRRRAIVDLPTQLFRRQVSASSNRSIGTTCSSAIDPPMIGYSGETGDRPTSIAFVDSSSQTAVACRMRRRNRKTLADKLQETAPTPPTTMTFSNNGYRVECVAPTVPAAATAAAALRQRINGCSVRPPSPRADGSAHAANHRQVPACRLPAGTWRTFPSGGIHRWSWSD